jgi:hypothetical protein
VRQWRALGKQRIGDLLAAPPPHPSSVASVYDVMQLGSTDSSSPASARLPWTRVTRTMSNAMRLASVLRFAYSTYFVAFQSEGLCSDMSLHPAYCRYDGKLFARLPAGRTRNTLTVVSYEKRWHRESNSRMADLPPLEGSFRILARDASHSFTKKK